MHQARLARRVTPGAVASPDAPGAPLPEALGALVYSGAPACVARCAKRIGVALLNFSTVNK
jgi:hypothetical protein